MANWNHAEDSLYRGNNSTISQDVPPSYVNLPNTQAIEMHQTSGADRSGGRPEMRLEPLPHLPYASDPLSEPPQDVPPIPPPHRHRARPSTPQSASQEAEPWDAPTPRATASRGTAGIPDPFLDSPRSLMPVEDPFSSRTNLNQSSASLNNAQSRIHPSNRSIKSYNSEERYLAATPFADNVYNRRSDSALGGIDPASIADDGDDGLDYAPHATPARRSMLHLGNSSNTSSQKVGEQPRTASGGPLGYVNGKFGHHNARNSTAYGPIPADSQAPMEGARPEKGAYLRSQDRAKRRKRLWLGAVIGVLVVCLIVGGIAGGVLGSKKANQPSSSGSGDHTAEQDDGSGLLNKDSDEIKKLMNNDGLKKVFPGMDYTPLSCGSPEYCEKWPPSQNNVTRDMAVLSKLTNRVRLYGNDCNQTEMVMAAYDLLAMTPADMKIWLGVWLDNNSTTRDRQISQMYGILDKYDHQKFAGVIIGNEVLYRKDITEVALTQILKDTKSNFTSHGIDLPVATSDLGDNWTAKLAEQVDVAMSNIHPFFAMVNVDVGVGWGWDFWQKHDVALTAGLPKGPKQVISEIGWPSGGGHNRDAVAGIDEMNRFMDGWVCGSFKNKTDYFWFEAFDEPWKIKYNEPDQGKEWEDKWGLMDVNRNLKPGIKIPDCDGQRVS